MKSSTYALAAVATGLLIISPSVHAALTAPGAAKLGLVEGSIASQVQGGKNKQGFGGWGGGYGVPGGGQKGGGEGGGGYGGGGGGGMPGGKQGGGGWGDKKGGGGGMDGGYGGGMPGGKQGGGGWGDKKGGGGMGGGYGGGMPGGKQGGGWGGKKGGGWGGYGGGGGGGVWKGERNGRYGKGPRFHPRQGYGYRPGFRAGCGWLRERALETGSRYWWRRFRECRAGF